MGIKSTRFEKTWRESWRNYKRPEDELPLMISSSNWCVLAILGPFDVLGQYLRDRRFNKEIRINMEEPFRFIPAIRRAGLIQENGNGCF